MDFGEAMTQPILSRFLSMSAIPLFLRTQSFILAMLLLSHVGASPSSAADAPKDPGPLPKGADYFVLRDGLQNSRLRFEKDKVGRVAFLGGSITAMSGWRERVIEQLQQRFPETRFDFISAGIPSLGSVPHAFRLERDVLMNGPVDLVLVEAAVNDATNTGDHPEHMLRGMEGVVRHLRQSHPRTDIVHLHFVMPEHMEAYRKGEVPVAIQQHERVAEAYGNPSLDLAREVTERIDAGQFTWEGDFKNLHPSPFGHRLYAASIERLFDAAWKAKLTGDRVTHPLPERLDPASYDRGRFGELSLAMGWQGFRIDPSWKPEGKARTRPGFVEVPALVGEGAGSGFTFEFTGRGVGLFITSGSDAGVIEFRIDGGKPQQVSTRTRWSDSLHLPWALMLEDSLSDGPHQVEVRVVDGALRIFHFLLN